MRLTEKDGTRLVRAPLAGGADRRIALDGDMPLASFAPRSNAVGKGGRLLAQLAPPASWFWPAGLIDPNTGRVQIIRVGYDADMSAGWTDDGKILVEAVALRASLWRFRPDATVSK